MCLRILAQSGAGPDQEGGGDSLQTHWSGGEYGRVSSLEAAFGHLAEGYQRRPLLQDGGHPSQRGWKTVSQTQFLKFPNRILSVFVKFPFNREIQRRIVEEYLVLISRMAEQPTPIVIRFYCTLVQKSVDVDGFVLQL